LAPVTVEKRRTVPDAAYVAHPERFVRKPPQPPEVPKEVWINKPAETPENKTQ
jgi:putative transposase